MILKPILTVVTLILYENGKYHNGNFNPNQSFLYLTIVYTISYTLALYALALFYVACKDLLQPFNPVPKFIIIKSVVFLTYWQVWVSFSIAIYIVLLHFCLFISTILFVVGNFGLSCSEIWIYKECRASCSVSELHYMHWDANCCSVSSICVSLQRVRRSQYWWVLWFHWKPRTCSEV